ncbi:MULTISPECIES: hypothetical protein [unclassified Streptomyces]|uniref:Uncharacterized protein n=1 Tax=Streptomyces sp. NBC_00060 TaxID=2975636 RepID=A0AAU2H6R8_9ACTN
MTRKLAVIAAGVTGVAALVLGLGVPAQADPAADGMVATQSDPNWAAPAPQDPNWDTAPTVAPIAAQDPNW